MGLSRNAEGGRELGLARTLALPLGRVVGTPNLPDTLRIPFGCPSDAHRRTCLSPPWHRRNCRRIAWEQHPEDTPHTTGTWALRSVGAVPMRALEGPPGFLRWPANSGRVPGGIDREVREQRFPNIGRAKSTGWRDGRVAEGGDCEPLSLFLGRWFYFFLAVARSRRMSSPSFAKRQRGTDRHCPSCSSCIICHICFRMRNFMLLRMQPGHMGWNPIFGLLKKLFFA